MSQIQRHPLFLHFSQRAKSHGQRGGQQIWCTKLWVYFSAKKIVIRYQLKNVRSCNRIFIKNYPKSDNQDKRSKS